MKRSLLIFFLIVLSLRLGFSLINIYFRQDNARDLGVIQQHLDQNQYIVGYGPKGSVGGFFLPPFYFQLHLLASLLTDNHPLTMQILITILESLTPVIVFLIIKELLDEKSAWVGAIIFTISVQVVRQAIIPWNPSLIPLISSLALWLSIRFVKYRNNKDLIPIPLLLVITIHLHYQSAVLAPYYFVFFIWTLIKDKKTAIYWLIGALLGLFITLPYFVTEYHNNWQNTNSIVTYFTSEHTRYFDRISKVKYVWEYLPSFFERVVTDRNFSIQIYGKILLYFGGFLIFSRAFVKKNKLARWILFYLVSIMLMLRVYKGDKHDYYLSTLYILPAISTSFIYHKNKLLGKILFVILAFYALSRFSKFPIINEVAFINNAAAQIKNEFSDNSYNLVIYDDVHLNTVGYMLTKDGQPNLDDSSLNVVEIINNFDTIPFEDYEKCIATDSASYSDQLHQSGGYQRLKVLRTNQSAFQVVIGKLKCEPTIYLPKPVELKQEASGIQFFY